MEKMRQWSMLTAVGVVVVLGLGWFLLVSPQRSHAADLRTRAQTQQAANATLQSQVNQLEQQKKGLPAQQRLLDQIATKIPDNPQLPALIRQLSAAAQNSGVDLVSLAPSTPTLVTAQPVAPAPRPASGSGTSVPVHAAAPAPLASIQLALNVTGSYFNIESFFSAVEKLNRAMMVTSWSLSPGGGAKSGASSSGTSNAAAGAPDMLNASITAVVYESPQTASAPVSPVAPAAAAK